MLMRLPPGDALPFRADRTTELLLLGGQLALAEQIYESGPGYAPAGDTPAIQAGTTGAALYYKSGFSDYPPGRKLIMLQERVAISSGAMNGCLLCPTWHSQQSPTRRSTKRSATEGQDLVRAWFK